MRSIRTLAGILIAVALTVVPAISGFAAAPEWLDADQIAKVLAGRTLDGVYASGRRFSERYLEGGALEYSENGHTLRGHWSITEGTLCTIYDTDPTGGCFRVAPVGGNCFEFYFVSRSEEQAPGPPDVAPHWTARGAVEGTPDACPDQANA